LCHRDGHLVHIESQASPQQNSQGKLTGVVCTIQDITQQLELERAVHRARRVLERQSRNAGLVANSIPEALFLVGKSNIIEYANPSAARLLGVKSPQELVGTRTRDWIYEPDLATLRNHGHTLEQGELLQRQVRLRRVDGELVPVLLTATARLEGRKLTGSIAVLEDLRSELERERQQQEQQKLLLESQAHYRNLFLQSQAARMRLEAAERIRSLATLCDTVCDLVRVVVEMLAQTLKTKLVSIYFVQDQELVIQHQVGYTSVIPRLSLSGGGVMVRAIENRMVELVFDAHTDPDFRYSMPTIRSELAVPILLGQEVLGVINLESEQVGTFTQEDAELLIQVAERIAYKIDATRKLEQYHELEQRYQRLLEQSQKVEQQKD
ncbi:MAG: PAS domain S-box protein, partial [Deinococcales bacterium]